MPVEETRVDTPNWPIIVWALYIASFVSLGVTMLIGVVIAYAKRRHLENMPASHMTYAIWTFWITVAVTMFGMTAPFDFAGIIFLPLMVWQLIRIFRGFVRAIDGRPIDNPNGLL